MPGKAIVKSIEISSFRGIKKGVLEGFRGINIFIGKNNMGKSTVLEAIYLATSIMDDLLNENPLEYIIKRREWFGLSSVESLFFRGSREIKISLTLIKEKINIEITPGLIPVMHLENLRGKGLDINNIEMIDVIIDGIGKYSFYIDDEGETQIIIEKKPNKFERSILIDWERIKTFGSPEDTYSYLIKKRGFEAKMGIINALSDRYPDITNIEPLKSDDRWILHVSRGDYSIPIYVEGDGIKSVLNYLMFLSSFRNSILLLEEPELHLHPGLMDILSHFIVHSHIHGGNQLFISTHSLELLDYLIEKAKQMGARTSLMVYKFSLRDNVLKYIAYSIDEAIRLRKEIEYDLR